MNIKFRFMIFNLIGLFGWGSANASDYEFRSFIQGSNACSEIKKLSIGYSGTIEQITVPAGASSAKVIVVGGAGSGSYLANAVKDQGGAGDYLTGIIPVIPGAGLYVIAGGGGGPAPSNGSGSGGGLSGIFSGIPDGSNALIVAGGGGGGANSEQNLAGVNGTNSGFNPTKTKSYLMGGNGFGGGGNDNDGGPGQDGTAFGAGAPQGIGSGAGGFGGGGSGGSGWGGGGGGGGLPGGSGGNVTSGNGSYGGQGGTSFVSSIVSTVKEKLGTPGSLGPIQADNGYVTINFYSCP